MPVYGFNKEEFFNNMKNLIIQTAVFLEVPLPRVFGLAITYAKMKISKKRVCELYRKFKSKDVLPDFVIDFCLDVLAHRIKIKYA